uniref:Sperm surface protein Sp17 n=1 Tax=Rhabditophanes sp. KR3021 TaxID=114890 RepID=A0AC35TN68_9BILA
MYGLSKRCFPGSIDSDTDFAAQIDALIANDPSESVKAAYEKFKASSKHLKRMCKPKGNGTDDDQDSNDDTNEARKKRNSDMQK